MKQNRIRQLWAEGRPALNGWLSIGSGFSAEIMAAQGYDTLTIDTQHGMMGHAEMVSMLQAMRASEVTPVVRVPWLDPGAIMRALDAGALGIICPMVSTREQAEQLVSFTRYPPLGTRSFGPTRALFPYGPGYAQAANSDVIVFAMIETAEAVDNLEEIVATPDLDAVYVGPSDLSFNLSRGALAPGLDRQEPEMIEAIRRILDATKSAGIRAGIFCATPEYAARAVEWGFDFVTLSNDVRTMAGAAAASVERTRALIGGGQ